MHHGCLGVKRKYILPKNILRRNRPELYFCQLMKISYLITVACLAIIFFACNKNSTGPLAVINTDPYLNKYAGTYTGLFEEINNGVDSDGVFKNDTSYNYTLKIADGGSYSITIDHGPVVISSIPVDSLGNFSFVDYNRNIDGHFVNDSCYIYSKALNGTYTYPQWFVIQQLSFTGKKEL